MRLSLLLSLVGLIDASTSLRRRLQAAAPDNSPYVTLSPLCAEPTQPPKPFNSFIHQIGADPATMHIDIPCNEHIIIPGNSRIDFAQGLTVNGKLTFEDNMLPIRIESTFILVRGWLEIGSEAKPYATKLNIVLKDEGADMYIEDPNLGQYGPMMFDKKGFVVLGGKVTMVGVTDELYGHLVSNVHQRTKEVIIGTKVAWKPGDKIAIASSIVRGQFSSYAMIHATEELEDGTTKLILEDAVQNSHMVRFFEKTMSQDTSSVYLRPEVTKINRNVVISGSDSEVGLGGYFTITHSAEKQIVEGVEFVNMGQIGKDGRYPIHIHFGGYVPEGTRISKNSIHHSLQRCVVVQATHNVLVNQNVAYHTHGHCFVTEDGIETGNKFMGNIAMHTVTTTADIETKDGNEQSDTFASAFYMASPANDIVGNVVAGVQHTGFFYESHDRIRGESAEALLPGYDTINVKHVSFGKFQSNLVHSAQIGLNPGYGRSPMDEMTFDGLTCWSIFDCWHSHSSNNISLDHVTAVDFLSNGVSIVNAHGFTLKNALLVGELNYPKDSSVCGTRMVAALEISATDSYTLQNIHFQKLSTRTNCQDHNVAVQILQTQNYLGVMHANIINLSFDSSVDEHYHIESSPYILTVQGMGAGDLPPNGAIVNMGSPDFPALMGDRCTSVDVKAIGVGTVYCPNSCWKTLVIEWNGDGEYVTYTRKSDGLQFRQMAMSMNVNGSYRKSATFTIPVGQYDFAMYNTMGGLVQGPVVRRYDLPGDHCGGEVYANES